MTHSLPHPLPHSPLFRVAFVLSALLTTASAPSARADELFVGSFGNQSVLRYDADTGASLGAFVPTASGGLEDPEGLLFVDGDLLLGNFEGDAVLRFDGESGGFLGVLVPANKGGLEGPHDLLLSPGASSWSRAH